VAQKSWRAFPVVPLQCQERHSLRVLVENAVGNYQLDDFLLVMAKPSLLGPSFNLDRLKHR
jgi:hypothetical protein